MKHPIHHFTKAFLRSQLKMHRDKKDFTAVFQKLVMASMFKASESNSVPLFRADWSGFALQGHIAVKYPSLAMQSYLSPLAAPRVLQSELLTLLSYALGAQVHVRPLGSGENPPLAKQSGSLHQEHRVSSATVGSSSKPSPELSQAAVPCCHPAINCL